MRERMFRVEIIQDAFCERRPKPQRLFRPWPGHRDMYSWCDLEVSRYPGAPHRCAHCTETREVYRRACDGAWKAECRLHRLATRASIRLLAAHRAWAETSRRQRAARTPEPGPPPGIWAMLGWARWRARRAEYPPATDRWFIVERRAAEAKLVRDHTRTLQRMAQRSRARARDRELAREAAHHLHAAEQSPDRVPGPDEKVTHGTIPSSSRGAKRRGDPGQRDKRLSRGPGLPRRQAAARNDEAHAAAPSDPPSEAAPPEAATPNDEAPAASSSAPQAEAAPPPAAPAPAPATPDSAPEPATPARPKIARIPYPPGDTTIIKIGAARPTIPRPGTQPRSGSDATAVQRLAQHRRLVVGQQSVPDEQVDQHQVDVELEVVGLADALDDARRRPQLEALDLVVRRIGLELLRQLQVVAMQPVAPQALGPLHRVGDAPDLDRALGQGRRDRRLLLRLLDQRAARIVAGRHAAGDDVVELAGIEQPVGPAIPDPDMQPAVAADQPVQMHPAGENAELRQRATVQPGERRPVGIGADVERLATPDQHAGIGQKPGGGLQSMAVVAGDLGGQKPERREPGQKVGEPRLHVADQGAPQRQGQPPPGQHGGMHGPDMAQERAVHLTGSSFHDGLAMPHPEP